jgi:hypothetical protein
MAVFLTDAYREVEENKKRASKKQETISNLVSGGIGKIISWVAWIHLVIVSIFFLGIEIKFNFAGNIALINL